MTDYYVYNSGSDTSPYDTWAKAAQSLDTIITLSPSSSDTIYIASDHSESGSGAKTHAFGGAKVYSVNRTTDAYEPMSTGGGAVDTDNTMAITGSGVGTAIWGVEFSGTVITLNVINNDLLFRDCGFTVTDRLAHANNCSSYFYNCDVDTSVSGEPTGAYLDCSGGCRVHWFGGTWTGASITGGQLLEDEDSQDILLEGVDLSGLSNLDEITTGFSTSDNPSLFVLRNCRLWTGIDYTAGDIYSSGVTLIVEGCAVGALTDPPRGLFGYRTGLGRVEEDTTQARTGGANDGTNGYSWKMVTDGNTDASIHYPLISPPIMQWISTANQILTVYLMSSDSGLTNKDVWLEITKPNESAAYADHDCTSTRVTNILGSGTALTADGDSIWTDETSMTVYKITHSVNPTDALDGGWISVRVALAKDATTIYLDPKLIFTPAS